MSFALLTLVTHHIGAQENVDPRISPKHLFTCIPVSGALFLETAEPFAQFKVIRQNGRKSDGSHRGSAQRSCSAGRVSPASGRGGCAEVGSRCLCACPDHRYLG